MTKYKTLRVTRITPYLLILIFSYEVVRLNFLLLRLDRYLFSLGSGNRYIPRGTKEEKGISINITGNGTISS